MTKKYSSGKIAWFFLLLAVIFTFFLAKDLISPAFERVCENPIAYTVGNFDPNFGISRGEFLEAVLLAEALWEEPSGRALFQYSPDVARLKINLVYDSRQETTFNLESLTNMAQESESDYAEIKSYHQSLLYQYSELDSLYESELASFSSRNREYNRMVESWNRGRRTSEEGFQALERERLSLEANLGEIRTMESRLNLLVGEINQVVVVLNRLARSLNIIADEYRTISSLRGDTFVGGIYHREAGAENIDIYEFSSRDKLIRILAHELGHALGLDHSDDPLSIMYHYNEGEALNISQSDLESLEAICGTRRL